MKHHRNTPMQLQKHLLLLLLFFYIYSHTCKFHIKNTMESWKSKTNNYNNKIFTRSKTNMASPCKKHPKHKQSPGVCSLCLNEKLFQLPNIGTSSRLKVAKNPESSSLSDISSLSSSNPSSCSSPVVKYTCLVDSNALKPIGAYGQSMLKKSRSMAFELQGRKKKDGKKSGFWSKILPRRKKQLTHSKTIREEGSLQFAAAH